MTLFCKGRWFVLLGNCLAANAALAQATIETPSTMVIQVQASAGTLTPSVGDSIVLQQTSDSSNQGEGSLTDNVAQIVVTKTSTYNGTLMILRLKRGTTLYTLKKPDNSEATFNFSGALLPVRQNIALIAFNTVAGSSGSTPTTGTGSPTTGTGSTTTGTGTPGSTSIQAGDINGDGVVDENDIALMKQAISGRIPIVTKTMDVNLDGVVNTRDMIEMIRAVRLSRQPVVVPVTTTATAAARKSQ